LLHVLQIICDAPGTKVAELPVKRLDAIGSLASGHRSGVAFDPEITRSLLLQIPGSRDCAWRLLDGELVADVYLKDETGQVPRAEEILDLLRSRQPWFSGSIVPDLIHLHRGGQARGHSGIVRTSPGGTGM
jgi:hypothetical protein